MMYFSSLALSALVLQNTFAGAASVGLGAMPQLESETRSIEKRVNCRGGANFVVYEFNNGNGGEAMLCLNGFVAAGCVLLMSGAGGIIETLKNKVTGWVTSKVGDASDAGPQEKREELDSKLFTWNDLYAYHAAHGSLRWEPSQVSSIVDLGNATVAERVSQVTAMELHEDGFSFSAIPHDLRSSTDGIEKRAYCYEQIHVHYWAAAGHDSTLLSAGGIGDLVEHSLDYAYQHDYGKACYELTNNGNWDGWLRVCFNQNQAQGGCYTCGGHNN